MPPDTVPPGDDGLSSDAEASSSTFIHQPLISSSPSALNRELTASQRLVVLSLFVIMIAIAFFSLIHPPPSPHPPQLALISIDGFAHSYLNLRDPSTNAYAAPTLRALAAAGASAVMRPCFPSKTFPCHETLATGLWPGSHGIVGNTMYDAARGAWFHVTDQDPHWWSAEPIWRTLSKAGRLTATVFWPGSSVAGRTADAFWRYNATVSNKHRVQRALDLLDASAPDIPHRPAFITLYFDAVDHAGHKHGPTSTQVIRAVHQVDAAIANFLARAPRLNVVVVSDHGMADISDTRVVDLDAALRPGAAFSVVKSPVLLLMNLSASVANIYSALSAAERSTGYLRAFRRENLPERWHLREAPHLAPVVALADVGWSLKIDHAPAVATAVRKVELGEGASAPNHPHRGQHGYDNIADEMQALFIASGPAFRAYGEIDGLEAVDVYPLLCEVFGVSSPAAHNGSLKKVQPIVRYRI